MDKFLMVLLTTIITFLPAICAGDENDSLTDGKFEWTWPSHLSYPNELSSQFYKADSSFIMERVVQNGEQVEQTLIMWVDSKIFTLPVTRSETDPLHLLWGKSAAELKNKHIDVIQKTYDERKQSQSH
ncbi:MAG: hypothetical protein Q8P32_01390 [Candidatus Komeilibacteria bacterium]|nr:hypothetical protein [Candidatus Komeilibacteria bacterium]